MRAKKQQQQYKYKLIVSISHKRVCGQKWTVGVPLSASLPPICYQLATNVRLCTRQLVFGAISYQVMT